jgi:hypothetical protein
MRPSHRRSAGAVVLSLCLLGPAVADAPPDRLARAWADLAGTDEAAVTRAVLTLAASPKEALPLLQKHLRPVKAEPKRVAELLKALDSEKFTEREAAHRELEYLGKYIKTALERERDANPSLEVKCRAVKLLERIEAEDAKPAPAPVMRGPIGIRTVNGNVQITVNGKQLDLTPRVIEKKGPQPVWLRAVRAVAVLEHIGTAEARQLVERMAAGEADALPTRAAAEALKRMKK